MSENPFGPPQPQFDPARAHGYGYQPQQPPAPRRKRHPVRNTVLALTAGLVVIGVIAGAAGAGKDTTTAATDTPAAKTSAAAAPPGEVAAPEPVEDTTIAEPPPAGPTMLLDQTGSGINNTKPFTAAGPWTLKYSFDCSGFGSGQGNFAVIVAGDDGVPVAIPVNALDASGNDSSQVYQTGSLHLEINSECTWHVMVVG
jgi:hypothetical protein